MITYRNRSAAFLWAFAAVFLLIVAAMSTLLLVDGPPPGYPPPAIVLIMALFWLFGLGLAGYAASRPCLMVSLEPGSTILVVRHYPFSREERRLSRTEAGAASVIEGRDDDGDPYFHARITLKDGTPLVLTEGHDRERCEEVCRNFNRDLAV